MLDALTITEAEAAGLSELAALDLVMAREFAARAQAAEDPETANDLARSYQRVARSYRQTLALKVRLAREIARAERDAAGFQPAPDPTAQRRRVKDIRGAVTRVITAELEGPEYEDERLVLEEALEDALTAAMLRPDFARRPLEDDVAEFCEDLELSPALVRRWRDLPDTPQEPWTEPKDDPADGPDWRGSG